MYILKGILIIAIAFISQILSKPAMPAKFD